MDRHRVGPRGVGTRATGARLGSRWEWLPLLNRVRTWINAPSVAVREQFATMEAMKRLVPDLGMSIVHGDGWQEG